MITTKELAEKTGLSARTLMRWSKEGFIATPVVGTHPSGRGKTSHWPEATLELVQKIQRLRSEGHTARSAAIALRAAQVEEIGSEVARHQARMAEIAEAGRREIPGPKADGRQLLLSRVVQAAEAISPYGPFVQRLIKAFTRDKTDQAFDLLTAGYNPVLIFDGREARVRPDFAISQELVREVRDLRGLLVIPLRPPMREVLARLGQQMVPPRVWPSSKVRVLESDVLTEYAVHDGGPEGFQLVRESAVVVGTVRTPEESQKE